MHQRVSWTLGTGQVFLNLKLTTTAENASRSLPTDSRLRGGPSVGAASSLEFPDAVISTVNIDLLSRNVRRNRAGTVSSPSQLDQPIFGDLRSSFVDWRGAALHI